MRIRTVERNDLGAITRLNNRKARWTGKKGKSFFENYLDIPFFFVIEEQGKVNGFLMAMSQSCDYGGKNFLWFKERFKEFYYVDRVVIEPKARQRGFGTALYHELLKNKGSIALVAEASIAPLNVASVKLHEKKGFKAVGTFSADGKKTCRMYTID